MYLGRVVGLGINNYGRPFAVYAVSGRSEGSKTRRAVIDKYIGIKIEPLEETTPEQEKMRDLIFYDAIRVGNGPKSGSTRYVIVSNGKQTDAISHASTCNDVRFDITQGFNRVGGAEPDEYKTPRIVGKMCLDDKKIKEAALGIVTENGVISSFIDFPRNNIAKYVSTYEGDIDDPKRIVISKLKIPHGEFDIDGNSAQELADNMYNWMDKDVVVCSAAALYSWDNERWELAVRNLHD